MKVIQRWENSVALQGEYTDKISHSLQFPGTCLDYFTFTPVSRYVSRLLHSEVLNFSINPQALFYPPAVTFLPVFGATCKIAASADIDWVTTLLFICIKA